MASTNSDYDVIWVVSGIGGCAAAITAAELGEPVLLLEHMTAVCVDSTGRAEPHPAFHRKRIDVRIGDANCAADDSSNVARIAAPRRTAKLVARAHGEPILRLLDGGSSRHRRHRARRRGRVEGPGPWASCPR